jgi:hypothetical protein
MKTPIAEEKTTLAKPVAAEDLRRKDFVAVLNETIEYPTFLWCGDVSPHDEPVRIQWKSFDHGLVLRVEDLCLPFIFVRLPCGDHRTLDIRRCQLVKLDVDYAKRVWRTVGGKAKNSRKRKSKKRRK